MNSTVYSDNRVVMEDTRQRQYSRREILESEENYASIDTSVKDEKRFLRGNRNLNDIIGSELLMKVNITFGSGPTPSDEIVRKKV